MKDVLGSNLNRSFLIVLMSIFFVTLVVGQKKKENKKRVSISILDTMKVDTATINATKEDTIAIQKAMLGDTLVPYVANKVERYNATIHYSNRNVRDTVDLYQLSIDVDRVNNLVDKMQSRIQSNSHYFNIQLINTSIIMLNENLNVLQPKSSSLSNYANRLMQNNRDVKRILKDPIFQLDNLNTDLKAQLNSIYADGNQLDTSEIILLTRINLARNKLSTTILKLNDLLSDLQYMEENKYFQMWNADAPALFKLHYNYYKSSIWQNISSSVTRTFKIVYIYAKRKTGIFVLGAFFLFATFFIAWNNMRKIKKSDEKEKILSPILYLKHNVALSMLFAFCTYFPFFFLNPPYSFLNIIEFIQIIFLSLLIWPYLLSKGRVLCIVITLICLSFCLDNQLLEPTFGERWFLFILCVGLLVSNFFLLKYYALTSVKFEKSSVTKMLTILSSIFAIFSLIFNISGLSTPMKLFGFTAIQILMLGISLKLFCNIALEFIYIQTEANKESRFSAFINYIELKSKYKRIFGLVSCIAWFIGIFHSMNLYGLFLFIVDYIFNHHIHIGKFDFTFYSIFIFVFIIWISSIVSRFVSFVLGGESMTENSVNKRNKIGTMTLLIRLAIWSLGFLIAIAASGIPLDKITIIIGALGVGIGFGLQNIVNNLVSGIILAFERPIQVGDSIEIGSKSGTVSEIGVRSSKLKVSEGADIIVPNGDLISQQITNWTLKDRRKRDFFAIRIAYGTDLYEVKRLLLEVLENNENVLKNPAVAVSVSEFGNTAVIMKAFFWVSELDDLSTIKSNLMFEAYTVLRNNGIDMPHDNLDSNP